MKLIESDNMDGMEIINSFKKETFYEFSEVIPVFNSEICFIFKADVISIETNPSTTKIDKLKKLIKTREDKSESIISHLDINPIAYILKTDSDYKIEPIDERYDSFIEENKNKLLEEFLKNKN